MKKENKKKKANAYPVRVRITESEKECSAGHKVGDQWIWEDSVPTGLCSSIFFASYNAYLALRYGGKEPEAEMILQTQPGHDLGWEKYTNKEMTMVYRRCPDPNIRVVISLERITNAGEEA